MGLSPRDLYGHCFGEAEDRLRRQLLAANGERVEQNVRHGGYRGGAYGAVGVRFRVMPPVSTGLRRLCVEPESAASGRRFIGMRAHPGTP